MIGDGGGVGRTLQDELSRAGHEVVCAPVGEDREAIQRALTAAFGERGPTAVVHLGSLEGAPGTGEAAPEAALETALARGYDSVLHTAQAIVAQGYRDAPRLWVVTRGAHGRGRRRGEPLQGIAVGLGRVIAMEHPELHCTRIDLSHRLAAAAAATAPESIAAAEVHGLLAELLGASAEQELALRGEGGAWPASSAARPSRGWPCRSCPPARSRSASSSSARASSRISRCARWSGSRPRPARWRSRCPPPASTSST